MDCEIWEKELEYERWMQRLESLQLEQRRGLRLIPPDILQDLIQTQKDKIDRVALDLESIANPDQELHEAEFEYPANLNESLQRYEMLMGEFEESREFSPLLLGNCRSREQYEDEQVEGDVSRQDSASTLPQPVPRREMHSESGDDSDVSASLQSNDVALPQLLLMQPSATSCQPINMISTSVVVTPTAQHEPLLRPDTTGCTVSNEAQNGVIEQSMSPKSSTVLSNEVKHDMTLESLSIQLQDQSDDQTSSLTTGTGALAAEGVLPAIATISTALHRRKASTSNLAPFPQGTLSKKGQRDAEPSTLSHKKESTKKGVEIDVEPRKPVLRRSKRLMRRNVHSNVPVSTKTQRGVAAAPQLHNISRCAVSIRTRNKGKNKRTRRSKHVMPGPPMETRQRKARRLKALKDAAITKNEPSIATKHNVKPEVSRVQTRSKTAKRRRAETSTPSSVRCAAENTRAKRARLGPSKQIQDRRLDSPLISC